MALADPAPDLVGERVLDREDVSWRQRHANRIDAGTSAHRSLASRDGEVGTAAFLFLPVILFFRCPPFPQTRLSIVYGASWQVSLVRLHVALLRQDPVSL